MSLLVLLYQLFLYGYIPSVPEKDFEKLVVSVAANKINPYILKKFKSDKSVADREVHAIAYLLRRMVKKKDSSYHISATAKEFCVALNKNYWDDDASKLLSVISLNGFIIALTRQLGINGVQDFDFYDKIFSGWSFDFSSEKFPYTSSQYRKFSSEILESAFKIPQEILETI